MLILRAVIASYAKYLVIVVFVRARRGHGGRYRVKTPAFINPIVTTVPPEGPLDIMLFVRSN